MLQVHVCDNEASFRRGAGHCGVRGRGGKGWDALLLPLVPTPSCLYLVSGMGALWEFGAWLVGGEGALDMGRQGGASSCHFVLVRVVFFLVGKA